MKPQNLIEIDGSQGEGGGQIVRSSLALSAVTGTPCRIYNIRAGRSKPGLMRQHLTAVRAIATISNANITGGEIGSAELTFTPQEIKAGEYHFQVGTAGSTSLVAQTILPALLLANGVSKVTLEGGTHNPWAPPYDFLERSFLPQLCKFGPIVEAKIESHGFFPAGGGKIALNVTPARQLRGIDLIETVTSFQPRVTAIVSDLPVTVGKRECNVIRRKTNWPLDCCFVQELDRPHGPGNVVMVELKSECVTEMFTGFGKSGVKAEHVARGVVREMRKYQKYGAPVGEYLADQLLMPMGLAADHGITSRIRTGPLSQHSLTHIQVLQTFLEIDIHVERHDDETCTVTTRQPS